MSCPSRKSLTMLNGVLFVLLSLAASLLTQELSADMAAQETKQQTTAQEPQQKQPKFGGDYSSLDARRQQLVKNWVKRFNEVTGQNVEAWSFLRYVHQVFCQNDV